MTSWKIQNNIIACIAELIKKRIKEDLLEYYAINADKVTDQFSNKEILLLCLRHVTYQNGFSIIPGIIFDSLHINGGLNGQTIGKKNVFLLEKYEIYIERCRARANDGASAMSSHIPQGMLL